ncbi:hypothetical protein ASD93_11425 [Microbacterium sp. Root180]|nr:hypothetical protein ASD93_11425 [Microbacterium sp. Root180]
MTTGADKGTAFAVSSRLLVTCRHVVEKREKGDEVELSFPGRPARTAKVLQKFPADDELAGRAASDRWPDLALLEVVGEPLATAVILDARLPADENVVYVGGFPAQEAVGYQTRNYGIGSKFNFDAAGRRYVLIAGESIDPGMSGAAVVTSDGFVCGYVRVTRGRQTQLGGFFVPIRDILPEIDDLRLLHDRPDPAVKAWLDLYKQMELKDFERDENGHRFDAEVAKPELVDIQLQDVTQVDAAAASTSIQAWTVGMLGADKDTPTARAVADLEGGVLEAVDYWSRRTNLADEDQVGVLGQVLASGLLVKQIAAKARALPRAEPPIVRLHLSKDRLMTMPWEYADNLATSPEWSFARYVDRKKSPTVALAEARVLIVLNAIEGVHSATFAESLFEYLSSSFPRIEFTLYDGISGPEFVKVAREGWDVIHIAGTGWSDGALAFPEQGGEQAPGEFAERRMERKQWRTIVKALAESRAKVVVLQVGTPRFEAPPMLSTFVDVFEPDRRADGSVVPTEAHALILTQHTTTTDHITMFTRAFYAALDLGYSIERAVQTVRENLRSDPPNSPVEGIGKDHAAFGAVSVVTTAEGNVRVLTAPPAATPPPPAGANAYGVGQGPEAPVPAARQFQRRGPSVGARKFGQ